MNLRLNILSFYRLHHIGCGVQAVAILCHIRQTSRASELRIFTAVCTRPTEDFSGIAGKLSDSCTC